MNVLLLLRAAAMTEAVNSLRARYPITHGQATQIVQDLVERGDGPGPGVWVDMAKADERARAIAQTSGFAD
jgi:hypothetical protein